MKNFYNLLKVTVLQTIILTILFSQSVLANWQKPENINSISSEQTISQSSEKKDSLPSGVTDDWLNDLRDENGNKIITENNTNTPREIPEDLETDAMQRKIFNGQGTFNNFGCSVSSAGDVNGDGFDDIVIGAFTYNSNTGRAYVFYGGLNMNTVADVILNGEALADNFGFSVSTAGDVNGDGYSDVIVGASRNDSGGNWSGRAYIYFGGTPMNNTADVIMTGETASDQFGLSVSNAGDVNGDGFSDVVIGASGVAPSKGKAYIFFGGLSMNNIPDVSMLGEAPNNSFGYSVSTAGDMNGNGFYDVIISAVAANKAYIYFGGASMNNVADVTMSGESAGDEFGFSVSEAGDVNGDGYFDVIVGARGFSSNSGRAYIYLGGSSVDNTADVTLANIEVNEQFGYSVSTAGDMNTDGYSDVIIGAYGYSSNTGRAYIFLGGAIMNNVIDYSVPGEETNSGFGGSVSNAGDVNGDGYSEFIVGSLKYNSSTGRAYIYNYFISGEITYDLYMTGEALQNQFGISVSDAGDVNADGFDDVIVGASGYNNNTGRSYIYFGGNVMNNIADVTLTGDSVSSFFGKSVSTAGDVNGDGYSDVIVGVPGSYSAPGKAYIYYGGLSMNNIKDITLSSNSININFGNSVSSAGDVNNDGFDDVIIGALGNFSISGKAFIFFGSQFMDSIVDITITNVSSDNYFAYSVSSAGDVNGDEYADVIIGNHNFSSGKGKALIYYGGSSMDSLVDVELTGETNNSFFGYSVSSAGDVNGDGVDDILVGAFGSNNSTGKAYIFFGGSSINNTADIVLTGESNNNNFGFSVSTAGDVNNDGFDDVIIGAYQYISNGSTVGRSYIYFGGSTMNNLVDVKMTGEAEQDYFGYSVSSAGDINGDGFGDVISGALFYDAEVYNSGKTYIYFGSTVSVKPIILSAKDVPNDQGGYLYLKFAKSSLDIPYSEVGGANYQIERSVPPNANGYQWISVGTVLGTYNAYYTAEIHTPYDSGSSGNNTFFFRVTAVSNTTGSIWRSNILSGYSLDNLAPQAPQNLAASPNINFINLSWNQNTENDLHHYNIYKDGIEFATSLSTSFNDSTGIEDSTYTYEVAAVDVNGNVSQLSNPVEITVNNIGSINLSVIVEGFYSAASNKLNMKDTMTVQLRNSNSPYSLVESSIGIIDSVTLLGSFKIMNTPTGNYYLAVRHRNSIETWSANPVSYTAGNTSNFTFIPSASQAFGSNQIQVDTSPVRYAIYSGDVNQDGTIDLTDLSLIDGSYYGTGYIPMDVNGDGVVDISDSAIADNNSYNFVGKVTP